MSSVRVSAEVAHAVLWHFGERGYEPGSFVKALLEAIAAADPANRARLGMGFPEHVEAMNLAQNELGGIARLREVVAGE